MKNHYRYASRPLLLTSIVIILSLSLAACSSSASSEVKITTRDQAAEVGKNLASQADWIEQVAPAAQAKQPAPDSQAVEPLQLLSNNPGAGGG